MRHLTPLLCALAVSLGAADDTPANRKLIQELGHAEQTEAIMDLTLRQMTLGMPEAKAKVMADMVETARKSGEMKAQARKLDEGVLRRLTNAELVAYHARQTKPEARSVALKMGMITSDILSVMMDEMQVAMGMKSARTRFEIEEPWDVVPAERRAILVEVVPYLEAQSGPNNPRMLKSTLRAQVDAEAARRRASPAQIAEVKRRIDAIQMDRISRALAESLARRLTTDEARWRLEAAKDPVYAAAEGKVGTLALESALKR